MESIIVLQARLDSRRLPAKALLNIGGMPLVVLAALRATNTGRQIIVATSNMPTDDALANTLKNYSIPFYRGSLENTLKRFVGALENYEDNTRVIRLTGDNIFPDGNFIDDLEKDFIDQKLRYLTTSGSGSGLPYGVSAEIMYLSDLRTAASLSNTNPGVMHVTEWVRNTYGINIFSKYKKMDLESYRATVDFFDDYISMHAIFESVDNPVNEPLNNLLKKIKYFKSEHHK